MEVPLKVLHYSQVFSALSETFIYDFIQSMSRQGVDCPIATLRRVNEDSRPYARVHRLRRTLAGHAQRRINDCRIHIGSAVHASADGIGLLAVLERERPDAVWAYFGPAGLDAYPACSSVGVPLIVSFHGFDLYRRDMRPAARYRLVFQNAAMIVAVGERMKADLIAAGAPEGKVIVNRRGVNMSVFTRRSPEYRLPANGIRLLQVGRFIEKKNQISAIRALERARRFLGNSIRLTLALVGEGPLEHRLRREARILGVESQVHFLGPIAHERIPEMLENSDIFILPSIVAPDGDQEGIPVSVIEASAMMLPTIVTDHSGMKEAVLDGQTGVVIPNGSPEALADAIVSLSRQPFLMSRLGQAARAHAMAHFDMGTLTVEAIARIKAMTSYK